MLLRRSVLSASFAAILAVYVVATPLRSTDETKSLDYHAPSYPSPPALSYPPPKPHVPKAYPVEKLKLEGLSYSPPSSKSSQEKPKSEEKSYPEKSKAEGKPYLPLPPPLFSPTPPPSKDGIEKPKVEKKPEEKSDAAPALKEDKAKPYDKPKSNEKPHSPPSPQRPHPQEKTEQDKQKNQVSKKGAKVGCAAGKCRRAKPVTCDIPRSRSFISNSTPSDCRVW